MPVEEDIFEGELDEIQKGSFVSFRYLGENKGLPMNPKVSLKAIAIVRLKERKKEKQYIWY